MLDQVEHGVKGYELRERIGAGGFGTVFRAYQPAVRREVAIKIILPRYANNPDFIRRFESEAQLVARLEYPYIVPLYDFWRDPEGAYLVMRWLRGGSLRQSLENGPWRLGLTANLLDQIAGALTVAHRNGVVHRDLKPDNILLDEDGNAYLADFGIAKDLTQPDLQNPESDTIVGSPAYFSPEQIQSGSVSPQADIYSLGILLYEILTGTHPFVGASAHAMFFKHLTEPVPSVKEYLPDAPGGIDDVLQQATAKDPAQRYSDVLSLAAAFRQVLILGGELTDLVAPGGLALSGDLTITMPGLQPAPENPYKGLRAFQEVDAVDFFGREQLVTQLVARLGEPGELGRFLAVIGPSGSGKSSAVRAGLIPRLRQGALPGSADWFVLEMLPGSDPFKELEAALLSIAINPAGNLQAQLRRDERGLLRVIRRILPSEDNIVLLFIDQFEEVFTLLDDPAERDLFLNSLVHAITAPDSPLRLVVTLRADFYDRPLLYQSFGDLLRQRTEVVLPLASEELERSIVGPGERIGMAFETGLVGRVLSDVNEQPGTLPLLQYALTELFERRDGNRLTLEAYDSSGGVLGSLARRAEDLYVEMQPDEQEAARQLFLRLVTLGEGTEDTRRRTTRAELLALQGDDDAVMEYVINRYGFYRLLTFDHDPTTREPTVEVAHEALIRQWSRLRDWLAESRDDLRMQQRLGLAAREWTLADQEPSYLATGTRLLQFEEWRAATSLALSELEDNYLQASIAERMRREAAEAARLAREAALENRSRTALRVLAVVLSLGILAAVVLAAAALNERQIAQVNADEAATAAVEAQVNADSAATAAAEAQASAAESQSLALASAARQALRDNNTDLALALAFEANRDPDAPTQAELVLADVVYAPGTRYLLDAHSDAVRSANYSQDGHYVVTTSRDQTLLLWDARTGVAVRRFSGHSAEVRSAAFSPDGRWIVSASFNGEVILWQTATGDIVHRFTAHTDTINTVAFSPDGRYYVSGADDRAVKLWDASSGALVGTFDGHTGAVYSVRFSPDGLLLVTASEDETVRVWDVATREQIQALHGHDDTVYTAVFSPNQQMLLSGGRDLVMLLWDLASGEVIQRFSGHTDWVRQVAFSPNGLLIASASDDRSVRLWEIGSGNELRRFEGHSNWVWGVDFSPDGRQMVSGSADGTARIWDTENGAQVQSMMLYNDDPRRRGFNTVDYSPDGSMIVTGGNDRSVILWDVDSGTIIRRFGEDGEAHRGAVSAVRFSPDGTRIASGSADRTIAIWDVATGEEIYRLERHNFGVTGLDFSSDGRLLLSGSSDRTLRLWNLETGESIYQVGEHSRAVTSVALSPGGRYAVASSGTPDFQLQSLRLWDVVERQEVYRLEGHSDLITAVAFSPDGQTFLSGGNDRILILWDTATGTEIRRFEGHVAAVTSVAFSPDGRLALSGSADDTARLWDIASGQTILRIEGHTDDVTGVAFSPDGRFALSVSLDSTVRLWRIAIARDALLDWARQNRYLRPLTCPERDQYHVEPLCPQEPTATPDTSAE